MAAETTLGGVARREVYLDRRICTISPDRIEVRPARSIIFLPLFTLAIGLAAFPAIFFWGDSLSIGLRMLLTLGALIIVPVSGLGLVYSIAGANIVVDRAKQSIVLQQGYLGMGVGTQELVPFWKIDMMLVKELTPEGPNFKEDFLQYEVAVLKLSGRELSVGLVSGMRSESSELLTRANDVAGAIATLAGSSVEFRQYEPPIAGDEEDND